jgi:hypothetical protein
MKPRSSLIIMVSEVASRTDFENRSSFPEAGEHTMQERAEH